MATGGQPVVGPTGRESSAQPGKDMAAVLRDGPAVPNLPAENPNSYPGPDKPLLTVGGRTMLAAVIAALDLAHIAISANGDPARFASFGLPVLPDGAFQGQGPLAGVLAGLEWAASLGMTALLTAPGDMPFLPKGLACALAPAPAGVSSHGQRHHLVALWPVASMSCLRRLLSAPGRRQVGYFAECIGMRYVDFAVPTGDPFANVNTRDELMRARASADEDQGRGLGKN